MQILAGKFKGKRLQSTASPKVRPTARRIRESLFEILGLRISGASFLDLCCGSGAVGLEALSRGANHVTFVDRSSKMCTFVRSNLELCGVLKDQFIVVEDSAEHFVAQTHRDVEPGLNIAYFDPPYAADYMGVVESIASNNLLEKKCGVLVVEHRADTVLTERIEPLRRWRLVRQGESCLSFYERKK